MTDDLKMTDDLITRLEAATEGSRELDRAIHLVIFADFIKKRDITEDGDGWRDPEYGAIAPPQYYTTSLDAAMMLIPKKEWSWKLVYEPGYTSAGPRYCVVLRHAAKLEIVAPGIVCSKETLPLALCIAALKARVVTTISEHQKE